jgi:hypothetical protein
LDGPLDAALAAEQAAADTFAATFDPSGVQARMDGVMSRNRAETPGPAD